jgi:catechol 2,3-dioxygenase-like lactoylglutathione lyase family enzyme
MTYKIEVLILPVSDVDRALAFYSEKGGFTLDVDYRPSDDFRVVQLTPPGSACSIQIGVALTDAAPGSIRGIHTVVEDLRAARDELLERGVEVGDIRHKSPARGLARRLGPGARSRAGRLRQLRRLHRSRRQPVGAAGTRLP